MVSPKQVTLNTEAAESIPAITGAELGLMETESVVVHPRSSVMTTVYVPAGSPEAVSLSVGGAVFQEYEYGGVPPTATAIAMPEFVPAHGALLTMMLSESAGGSVIVTVNDPAQPVRLSKALTVYVPAGRLFCVGDVEPLCCHTKDMGVPGTAGAMVADPSVRPLHDIFDEVIFTNGEFTRMSNE